MAFAGIFRTALMSIYVVTLLLTGDVPTTSAQQTPFSFDDIFDPVYRPKSFSGQWLDGNNEFLYRDSVSGAVMKFNAVDKSQTVFIDNTTFNDLQTGTYYVSPDLQYALFAYERTAVWRHSFTAKYKILNVATKVLSDFPVGPLANTVLQYAAWSSVGNALTFVTGNNLYHQASPSVSPQPITNNGDATWIYNGIPDWLYEEDVLSDRVSRYASPNGRYICYAELNDTGIPLQAWPWYGSKDDVYGKTIHIPYPKAGDVRNGQAGPNTRVTLFVIDILTGVKKTVPTVSSLLNKEHYYLQVTWRDDNRVMVVWANRVQNESFSAIYDVTQPSLSPVENHVLLAIGGWVEVPPATPWFIDGGQNYLTILPHLVTPASGRWRHLALVSAPTIGMGTVTFESAGEQEVDYIVGYNEIDRAAFYIGTGGDPAERHLFRKILGGGQTTCLTCSQPDTCRYVTAQLSSTYIYYILGCRGPDVPVFTLTEVMNPNAVYMLENNDAIKAALATKLLPTREFIDVPVNGGYTGRAEVFIPPGHGGGNKYPLLVYAYAGPGSQRVMKTFAMGGSTSNWLLYLKSTHNIAVASLDARGSMAAGDKLKFEMYRKLSTVEVQDQITGGEYFSTLAYVDTAIPLGIFGWSYGGGVAAHVIGDTSKTFTCGISVAPVTTKMYYDTAYTERYLALATPDDDAAGYAATDVMNKANNFQNKTFLIAHGTADDNVHFMHTAHLISALADAGVQFRQNIYVDQNHGISAPGQSRHLYATMTNFLLNDCWRDRRRSYLNTYSNAHGDASTRSMAAGSAMVVCASLMATVHRYFSAC